MEHWISYFTNSNLRCFKIELSEYIRYASLSIKLRNKVKTLLEKVKAQPEFTNIETYKNFMKDIITSCFDQYVNYLYQANLLEIEENIKLLKKNIELHKHNLSQLQQQQGGTLLIKNLPEFKKIIKSNEHNKQILKKTFINFSKAKDKKSKISHLKDYILALEQKIKILEDEMFKNKKYLIAPLKQCLNEYLENISSLEFKKIAIIEKMLEMISK